MHDLAQPRHAHTLEGLALIGEDHRGTTAEPDFTGLSARGLHALDGPPENSAPQNSPGVAAGLVETAQVLESAGDLLGAAASLD